MSDHGPVDPNCRNCGAELHGHYCHSCGQKATSLAVTLHDFAHEATHEFLHLDGKILTTMKLLLFRPGQLTREFLDGRRARYVSPIRVYLTWSVLFFALATTVPQFRQSFVVTGSKPRTGTRVAFDEAPVAKSTPTAADREEEVKAHKAAEALMHQLPRAMFLLMPLFAIFTWVAYRRQNPYYIAHMYHAIHFHAFVFVLLTLALIASAAGQYGTTAGSLVFLTAFPYHYMALRRVFGGSRMATLLKGTAVGVLYWLTAAITTAGLALMTIKTAGL